MTNFVTRIKDLRLARRYTQHDMDDRLGMGHGNYCRYELGMREPDMQTLIKIADVFGVSLDYLMCRTDSPYYIVNTDDGTIVASTKDPTVPDKDPVVIGDLQWMPKTEKEFKEYILKLTKGKSNG